MLRYLNIRKSVQTYMPVVGALITAILASTCCIAPFMAIAGLFGVSVAQLAWLASIKTYLILLSLVAIGYSLYKAYKKPKAANQVSCCQVVDSDNPTQAKISSVLRSKTLLWIIALVTILTLLAPYITNAQDKKGAKEQVRVSYKVEKLTQSCCSVLIEYSLKKVNGYHKMEADVNKRQLTVWYNPSQTNPKILKAAIDKSGYPAELIK